MATNPFGPVQIMVLGFSGATLNAEVKKQFNALRKQGLIRVIDFTYLAKAEDGKLTTRQATDFSDAERVKLGATVGALIGYGAAGVEGAEVMAEAGAMSAADKEFGMSKEDLMNVADGLPRGSPQQYSSSSTSGRRNSCQQYARSVVQSCTLACYQLRY